MITEYENTASWCNANGVVTSDSGFSNECAISDMNDLCCFADCIDVTVNNEEHEERSMNIVVESDRRLLMLVLPHQDGRRWKIHRHRLPLQQFLLLHHTEGNAVVEEEERRN
ncbi:WSSV405 [White spot syndrome virus]|uniref:WSSV405 n=1 Tax=White spot syndrome virus TaxID=342409 RepID=A0A2I6SC91_9VIRU|nr:WSSV405 [White spot syndrome virus]